MQLHPNFCVKCEPVKMKWQIFLLALLVTAFVALSEGRSLHRHRPALFQRNHQLVITKALRKFKADLANHEKRTKRQNVSPSCVSDVLQTYRDPFKTCGNIFESFPDVSDDNITTYCRMHCPSVMVRLYTKITADCDNVGPVNQTALNFLNQSCNHDPKGRYCIYDWEHAQDLFPSDDFDEFNTCSTGYPQSHQCSDACRTATRDISTIYGCCYWAVYGASPDGLIPLNAFTSCGYRKPTRCTR